MEAAITTEVVTSLAKEDRDYLHSCAITDLFIDGRPYVTLNDELRKEAVEEWGFHPEQVAPSGILIPRYNVATGEMTYPQVRYHQPRPDSNGELMKYCSPKGSGGVIDCHPFVQERVLETLDPLWIPESIKGGDAIASNGGISINIFGVGGWLKDGKVASALEAVPLRGRVVNVAYDSDVRDRDKRGPLLMLAKFCHYLIWARGAKVNVARLPFTEDGQKTGIDDVLPEVF